MTLKKLTKIWKTVSSASTRHKYGIWELDAQLRNIVKLEDREKLREIESEFYKLNERLDAIVDPVFGKLYRQEVER